MTPVTSAKRIAHRELRLGRLRIHAQIRGEGEPLLMYSPPDGALAHHPSRESPRPDGGDRR